MYFVSISKQSDLLVIFQQKRLPMPYVSYVTFTKMMKSKHKIPTFEALLKVTLETIEQLLMLPKVNTKHKRTTS